MHESSAQHFYSACTHQTSKSRARRMEPEPLSILPGRVLLWSTGLHYTLFWLVGWTLGSPTWNKLLSRLHSPASHCSWQRLSHAGTCSCSTHTWPPPPISPWQMDKAFQMVITFIDVRWYTNRSVSISLSTSPRFGEKLEEWGRQGNRTGLSLQDAELSGGEQGQGLQQRRVLLPEAAGGPVCSAYSLDAMWTIKSTTRLLYPYSLSYLGTENKRCQGWLISHTPSSHSSCSTAPSHTTEFPSTLWREGGSYSNSR